MRGQAHAWPGACVARRRPACGVVCRRCGEGAHWERAKLLLRGGVWGAVHTGRLLPEAAADRGRRGRNGNGRRAQALPDRPPARWGVFGAYACVCGAYVRVYLGHTWA
eukprot:225359-Chlamydomonas_euryale.AAC.1